MIQGNYYIDGRWQAAASGRKRAVIKPALQVLWGGFKQSGIGRELGRQGLEEYTEVKHIYRNYETRAINWFGV